MFPDLILTPACRAELGPSRSISSRSNLIFAQYSAILHTILPYYADPPHRICGVVPSVGCRAILAKEGPTRRPKAPVPSWVLFTAVILKLVPGGSRREETVRLGLCRPKLHAEQVTRRDFFPRILDFALAVEQHHSCNDVDKSPTSPRYGCAIGKMGPEFFLCFSGLRFLIPHPQSKRIIAIS